MGPVGVTVEVGPVGTVGGGEQLGLVIVLVSRLTWPLRARTRPWIVAPVSTVMLASAMTVPTKVVVVPMVAELPTCQKTLQACAPPWSATLLPDAVSRVEPAWKMNTAAGSPCASRVTVPVSAMVTRAVDTRHERLPTEVVACLVDHRCRPAASLYAVVRSCCACRATASAAWITPR